MPSLVGSEMCIRDQPVGCRSTPCAPTAATCAISLGSPGGATPPGEPSEMAHVAAVGAHGVLRHPTGCVEICRERGHDLVLGHGHDISHGWVHSSTVSLHPPRHKTAHTDFTRCIPDCFHQLSELSPFGRWMPSVATCLLYTSPSPRD